MAQPRASFLEYCLRLLLERDFTGYHEDVTVNVDDPPGIPKSLFADGALFDGVDTSRITEFLSVEFLLNDTRGLAWKNCHYHLYRLDGKPRVH